MHVTGSNNIAIFSTKLKLGDCYGCKVGAKMLPQGRATQYSSVPFPVQTQTSIATVVSYTCRAKSLESSDAGLQVCLHCMVGSQRLLQLGLH